MYHDVQIDATILKDSVNASGKYASVGSSASSIESPPRVQGTLVVEGHPTLLSVTGLRADSPISEATLSGAENRRSLVWGPFLHHAMCWKPGSTVKSRPQVEGHVQRAKKA